MFLYFDQKPSFHTEDIVNLEPENTSKSEPESELSRNKVSKGKPNGYVKSETKSSKSTKSIKTTKTTKKTKTKSSQKGGTMEIDYLNQTITYSDDDTIDSLELEQNMGRLESDDDMEDGYIDLNL